MYKRACAICSGVFESKRPEAKYCSEKCRSRQETIRATEKKRRNRVPIVKKCGVCGEEFTASLRNPYQIYCSPSCLNKAMHRRSVDSGRKRELYRKHKEKYAALKSDTDLEYKDNLRFSGNKKHVLDRDGHRCVDCGVTTGLIIHHKDGSGKSDNPNNDLSNLVTLCRSCHMKYHSGENSHNYIHITKEQILSAKAESSSWAEVARRFNIDKTTLIRKRKQFGIF